jgi:hypothetical protein
MRFRAVPFAVAFGVAIGIVVTLILSWLKIGFAFR